MANCVPKLNPRSPARRSTSRSAARRTVDPLQPGNEKGPPGLSSRSGKRTHAPKRNHREISRAPFVPFTSVFGAAGERRGALRERAGCVPKARAGRQLGLQQPVAAPGLSHSRQQPRPNRLWQELGAKDVLRDGRQPLGQAVLGGCSKSAEKAQELTSLGVGAQVTQMPHAPLTGFRLCGLARHPFF